MPSIVLVETIDAIDHMFVLNLNFTKYGINKKLEVYDL